MNTGCCCTICLEFSFKDLQVTKCGHVFHRQCIYRWIDKQPSCPNCKTECHARHLSRLFLNPLDVVKEVFKDPTCLESVDPKLLLQFTGITNNMGGGGGGGGGSENNGNSHAHANHQLQVTSLNLTITALEKTQTQAEAKTKKIETKNAKLVKKVCDLKIKMKQHEVSQDALATQCFELQDEIDRYAIEAFKKNKEINSWKDKYQQSQQRQIIYKHITATLDKNKQIVAQIERELHGRPMADKCDYLLKMYSWQKREHLRLQTDKSRDEEIHENENKIGREIQEQLRVELTTVQNSFELRKNKYTKLLNEYKKILKSLEIEQKKRKKLEEENENEMLVRLQLQMKADSKSQNQSNSKHESEIGDHNNDGDNRGEHMSPSNTHADSNDDNKENNHNKNENENEAETEAETETKTETETEPGTEMESDYKFDDGSEDEDIEFVGASNSKSKSNNNQQRVSFQKKRTSHMLFNTYAQIKSDDHSNGIGNGNRNSVMSKAAYLKFQANSKFKAKPKPKTANAKVNENTQNPFSSSSASSSTLQRSRKRKFGNVISSTSLSSSSNRSVCDDGRGGRKTQVFPTREKKRRKVHLQSLSSSDVINANHKKKNKHKNSHKNKNRASANIDRFFQRLN